MTFPLTFACALLLIGAFCLGLKLAAEFGDKRAVQHLQKLRKATPPHEYTRDDGTKGRWP